MMRKLIYSTMLSLDGFIEDSDHSLDWVIIDEELHRFVNDQEQSNDLYLYGRRMYEAMLYWQTAEEDPSIPDYMREFAQIWKRMPKIVFSHTLERVVANTILVRDDPIQTVQKLRSQPGGDIDLGGATLAAPFLQRNLVDEYRLYIHPVMLGAGKPAFPVLQNPLALKLTETHKFQSGVLFLRYQK
jgi:dihydrofolate reductase